MEVTHKTENKRKKCVKESYLGFTTCTTRHNSVARLTSSNDHDVFSKSSSSFMADSYTWLCISCRSTRTTTHPETLTPSPPLAPGSSDHWPTDYCYMLSVLSVYQLLVVFLSPYIVDGDVNSCVMLKRSEVYSLFGNWVLFFSFLMMLWY